MTRRSQSIVLGFALLVAALVMGTQSGCGGSQRRKVIGAEVAALKTARAAVHDWDVESQVRIAQEASSREDGEAKLKIFRAGRDQITRAFAFVYEVLADASSKTDDVSLKKALEVSGALLDRVKDLKAAELPAQRCDPPIVCNGF